MRNKIVSDLNLDISWRTVNNWLLRRDYAYSKSLQQIQLTREHKIIRMEKVSKWIEENIVWENVAFTNEKMFSLVSPDNW